MKHLKLLSLLWAVLFGFSLHAQVTTDPSPLEEDADDVWIYFHADQGSKGLAGTSASTPLYAHTGVITSQSKNDSDWKYAPSWDVNSDKYRLEFVENNLWKLYIGNIREFYGITDPKVTVKKLAFVFRNANGSKTGKADGDKDIMVDVISNNLEMAVTCDPSSNLFTTLPYTVNFTVTTTKKADITLTYKGETIGSASDAQTLTAPCTFSTEGNHIVTATATVGDEKVTFARSFSYVAPSPEGTYPGGVPVMGPVANADGSVTFCIAAPQKQSVLLVGEWDDYDVESNDLMQRQDYEGIPYFFKTIEGLDPTKAYGYYFIIDGGQSKVSDPYARLVLDPSNDNYITDVVYPDMPQYPFDKVNNVVLAIYQGNINDYDWQVKDFTPAEKENLIIYELLLRDFTGTDGKALGNGTVRQAIEKIPYLKQLGVNAVELLPINEFNGNNSWGYNPNFYFAPDKAYGTPADYKEFIDKCHAEGIAVFLDMVFNQSDWQHPWYRMYSVGANPMYNATAPHAYSVLNDWNQGHPLVRQQWKDVVKYWLTEYNVDGFRFDLVKGLGDNDSYANNGDAATGAYNASRVANMRAIQEAMLEANDKAIVINENLAGAKEENEMAAFGQLNWANVNDAGCQYAMGFSSSSGLERMYAPDDSRTWGSTVSYLESHDEQRLAYKQEKWGTPSIKNDPQLAMNRLASCAAQMILSPGAHMIWQFSEMGNAQNTKNDDGGNNVDPKIVSWYLLDNPENRGLMENYSELIAIRNNNPSLFSQKAEFTSNVKGSAWSDGRWMHSKNGKSEIITVLNPSTVAGKQVTVNISFASKNNSDYQVLTASKGTAYDFSAADGTVTVDANGYVVIGTKDITEIGETFSDAGSSLSVMTAPGELIILSSNNEVRVFSLDGGVVYAGNASRINLPAGIYIVTDNEETAKVIVK